MATPFFEYDSQKKNFLKDSVEAGEMFVAFCLPFGITVGLPIVPRILSYPLVPAMVGLKLIGQSADYVSRARYEWTRSKQGPAETSIREIFGDIAVKGYKYHGGGVELEFTEAQVVSIYDDGKRLFKGSSSNVHHNREEGAKDLLGKIAENVHSLNTGRQRLIYKKQEAVIAVRKKGELQSTFYTATKIESPEKTPDNSVTTATHSYYHDVIGHGGRKDITHYAITKVDEQAAKRLRGLGL